MNLVGKIFAILVLVLSLAIAVLSWKLADQRNVFRAHSEALAQGLQRVAKTIRDAEGVDVSAELSKVSYTKAPEGGKESGTLGFEDFRKNNGSVKSAVDALVAGIAKRQEQTDKFVATLQSVGRQIGVPTTAGVNKEGLLADEYDAKLKALADRAALVASRDEAVRKNLNSTAEKIGASTDEIAHDRYVECARDGAAPGGFAVGKTFGEIENGIELLQTQSAMLVKSMNDFIAAVDEYSKTWSFNGRGLKNVESFTTAVRAGKNDAAARQQFISKVKSELARFTADAENLNAYIKDVNNANKKLRNDKASMQETVDRLQENLNSTKDELVKAQKAIEDLEKNYAWAEKNLKELQQAKSLNEDPQDNAVAIEELKDVRTDFSCDVRLVEPQYNFVILSAGNRQVCKGTRMIVLDAKDEKNVRVVAKVEVKECSDHLSKAYVIGGNVNDVSVGDRVELSVEHESLVKNAANAKQEAVEARERAAKEEEIRKAREQIEKRRAAERQAALEAEEEN